MTILQLLNLRAKVNTKTILKGINLSIKANETHVIMGPNGSGKSTLAKVIAGYPGFEIDSGDLLFLNQDLKLLTSEERAKKGLFLAFQSPIEIAGLSSFDFFHLIYNEHQKFIGQKITSPVEFLPIIQDLFKKLEINFEFLARDFNDGFSGGEKKRNEIIQMLLLQPKLIILDEIDSGLDLDILKKMCYLLKQQQNTSFLFITHSPTFVELLNPNFVHIFCDGKIQKTGNITLAYEVSKNGYKFFNF